MAEDRAALEARWLKLTRETLPSLAGERGWPVHADHCFQRILLDAACGMRWYDAVAGRPAYRHIDRARLARAVAFGEAVVAGDADIVALNAQSLAWRRGARKTDAAAPTEATAERSPGATRGSRRAPPSSRG